MTSELDRLRAVLSAAQAVLAAREDQMLTRAEWDALQTAVAAASTHPEQQEQHETDH
jgi:hypothetical protein